MYGPRAENFFLQYHINLHESTVIVMNFSGIHRRIRHFQGYRQLFIRLGFTLVEIVVVIAIIGSLAGIATPSFVKYKNKVRNDKATNDIKGIEAGIEKYLTENSRYPTSLQQTGMGNMRDPWGNPYQYLMIQGNPDPTVNMHLRKNMFNVPVNTDFDLYSMGPDGLSHASFSMNFSRDDIVRAYDGTYYGAVSEL